jgi:hypothetical protein
MSELTKEQREELKGIAAAIEAVGPLVQQVERLERSLAMAGEVQLTGHHHWGMQLMEQLGRFIEQAATAATPMTTKIMARFTDVDFPAMHIWATTSEKEPAARCAELAAARAALEAAVAERDKEIARLRQQLTAAEERAGNLSDAQLQEWADRHDLRGSLTELRCIAGDARTTAAQAAGKAE